MKAADFDYVRPETVEAAVAFLDDATIENRLIAGGQSLMAMMNFRLAQPERLIDLGAIETLRFTHDRRDDITIGAMTTFAELEKSKVIAEHFPLLQAALHYIAHPAIRSRGTIGGSAALADPAAELPALLLVAKARLNVVSTAGRRTIDAVDFFLGPYETALADNELVESLTVPKAPSGSRFAFYELARRHGDYAMVGTALAADAVEPISNLRVAFFAVGDKAIRIPSAETAMQGKFLGDADAIASALAALEQILFRGDLNANEKTKRHLAQVALRRAFAELSS